MPSFFKKKTPAEIDDEKIAKENAAKLAKYGNLNFISFYGAVLSRLAYLWDDKFLKNYCAIMGPVIPEFILGKIDGVTYDKLELLEKDQELFELDKAGTPLYDYSYPYKTDDGKEQKGIDFLKLQMPQNINIINEELKGTRSFPIETSQTKLDDVKCISLAWSNYGEVHIVADKRMPHTIIVAFRGTYSAKTAALYAKPTSLFPQPIINDKNADDKFLYGIFKPTVEMIHTIIESITHLATDFLGATEENSIKILTAGHSLGGAMCTNFAWLWIIIKENPQYQVAPYNVLAPNLVCISLGAPRCMSAKVADKFCQYTKDTPKGSRRVFFRRITTDGDPVPALPPAGFGVLSEKFEHPCSNDEDSRKKISQACKPQLKMRPFPNVEYSENLDCLNVKRSFQHSAIATDHVIYLDILYLSAVDIGNFLKGIGVEKEIQRQNGSTVCRIVMASYGDMDKPGGGFKAVFFDVGDARKERSNEDAKIEKEGDGEKKPVKSKFGGKVPEDVKVSNAAFKLLIENMKPLTGNLSPLTGTIVSSDIFKGPKMSDIIQDPTESVEVETINTENPIEAVAVVSPSSAPVSSASSVPIASPTATPVPIASPTATPNATPNASPIPVASPIPITSPNATPVNKDDSRVASRVASGVPTAIAIPISKFPPGVAPKINFDNNGNVAVTLNSKFLHLLDNVAPPQQAQEAAGGSRRKRFRNIRGNKKTKKYKNKTKKIKNRKTRKR